MSTVIPYIIHIWTPLRWYVKVILILILLRIVNTIYRVFFESSNAKQKREKQENEYSTDYSDKVNQFKRRWKEIDTVLSRTPPEKTSESFTNITLQPESTSQPTVWNTTLAMMKHIWNRIFEAIYSLHRIFKQFMYAFLADFVAPKLYTYTKPLR
jgi:hypothetical protein